MKNIDELVSHDTWPNTFSEAKETYERLTKRNEKLLNQKKEYDALLNDESDEVENEYFSFKDQWVVYKAIIDLMKKCREKEGGYTYAGIDLTRLKQKLEYKFEELSDYLNIITEINNNNQIRESILTSKINFNIFYEEHFDERCMDKHYFVRLDDNTLTCMSCGATITTEEYSISKDDLDFITKCAGAQGILLKEVTKDDLPLLQVLMEENEYQRSLREPLVLDPDYDDDYFIKAEEYWLQDQSEISCLRRDIKKAHLLDSRIFDNKDLVVHNPKYFSDKKTQTLLQGVQKTLDALQNTDSRFKKLMIEICKTAQYEILILSGEHIPTLYKEAKDEEERIALVKAYYNISNSSFRKCCDYFGPEMGEWDSISYDCITANPDINKKLLQMKVKR